MTEASNRNSLLADTDRQLTSCIKQQLPLVRWPVYLFGSLWPFDFSCFISVLTVFKMLLITEELELEKGGLCVEGEDH